MIIFIITFHLPQNNISGAKQELDNGETGNELSHGGEVKVWRQHAVGHCILCPRHQLGGGDCEAGQPNAWIGENALNALVLDLPPPCM